MNNKDKLAILEDLACEVMTDVEAVLVYILIDMNQEKPKSCKNHPKDLDEMMEYCHTYLDWPITEKEAKRIWQYYCPPGGDILWRDKKNALVKDWRRRLVTCRGNNGTKQNTPHSTCHRDDFTNQTSAFGQDLSDDV